VVDAVLAEFLVQKKIMILGLDTPSPDNAPFGVHKALMAAGILVLENLTNLDRIPADQQFEVIALPLKIKANGSPARVIARVG
jgi:kynurenine formamidase